MLFAEMFGVAPPPALWAWREAARGWVILVALLAVIGSGCGTTKWTETRRTATEQLLISDSMDQAVGRIDFRALTGKKVYLDDTYLKDVVDSAYLVSSLRQQLLSHGAILKEKKEEADYVVEVRSGAVGTNQHSVLVGIPQISLPSAVAAVGLPTALPEIPLIKKTQQLAVTKILLFAYNRKTGRPLWQSGVVLASSDARDVWIFGAGPFQKGSIYEGTQFAGSNIPIKLPDVPLIDLSTHREPVSLLEEAFYAEPLTELSGKDPQESTNRKDQGLSAQVGLGSSALTSGNSPPPGASFTNPVSGSSPEVASPFGSQPWPAFPAR